MGTISAMNKKKLDKFIHIAKNKYFVASFIFVVWISFFDENNLVSHRQNRARLKSMKEQQVLYKIQIEADREKFKELNSGPEELEKYAREQFNMTKPKEDLFIVSD